MKIEIVEIQIQETVKRVLEDYGFKPSTFIQIFFKNTQKGQALKITEKDKNKKKNIAKAIKQSSNYHNQKVKVWINNDTIYIYNRGYDKDDDAGGVISHICEEELIHHYNGGQP